MSLLLLLLSLLGWPGFAWAQDKVSPTVTITSPTSQGTFATTALSLAIGGTAQDNVGVTRVTWRTSAGAHGRATGTTDWHATVPLSGSQTRITVTAFDAAGNRGTASLLVTASSPLEARIDATPLTGAAPLTVQFIDSSNGSHTTWAWSFGDGATSALQSPSHIYKAGGSYTVSLTITGAGGASTQTKPNYIIVTGTPPPPGPITVEWSYAAATGDAFQMERCTESQPGCPMASIASIAISDRQWTDQNVSPTENYCYRMAVTTGGTLGAYSNTLCSP